MCAYVRRVPSMSETRLRNSSEGGALLILRVARFAVGPTKKVECLFALLDSLGVSVKDEYLSK